MSEFALPRVSTSDEQKAALAWLDECILGASPSRRRHAATLKAMLAEPRMPKEPPTGAIVAMFGGMDSNRCGKLSSVQWEAAYRDLRAHLSKPATKEVEVWRVEAAQLCDGGAYWSPFVESFLIERSAHDEAGRLRRNRARYACVHVTGPHKQQVPA